MKTLEYTVDLTDKIVVKTEEEQFDKFFYSGHTAFLIPDFCDQEEDIWLSFMEYLENNHNNGEELYDQDGGEITSKKVINETTGLTKCTYEAYGIVLNEGDDETDYKLDIEGYIIEDGLDYYFLATKVSL